MKTWNAQLRKNVVEEKLFVEGMVVAIEPMINMGTKTSNNWKMAGQFWLQMENQVLILSMMLLLLMGNLKYYPLFAYVYQALELSAMKRMSSEKYHYCNEKTFQTRFNTIPRPYSF
jgi:methionine aminopeptidase